MIRVFADDLTGAAELAGMCKQHGLKTILTLVPEAQDHAEAIVYCTDSRSMDLASALTVTQQFLEPIASAKNGMVYKKTDSVLRGHVMDELLLQMHQMGYQRVLFIPQNPSMGRIIIDGQYFVNGKLLSETSFADDPELTICECFTLNRFENWRSNLNTFSPVVIHFPFRNVSIADSVSLLSQYGPE
jgi:uncharacterized protein YgbK (DUF1537 family)